MKLNSDGGLYYLETIDGEVILSTSMVHAGPLSPNTREVDEWHPVLHHSLKNPIPDPVSFEILIDGLIQSAKEIERHHDKK